jgi:hypothetical protein
VDHRVPALSRLASGTLGGLLFAVNYVVVWSFCPKKIYLTCLSLFLQVLLHYSCSHAIATICCTSQ